MEKEISMIKQSVRGVKRIEEMLKKVTINTQYVEEEIVIVVKYLNAGAERMMLIDSGAPKSIVSSR